MYDTIFAYVIFTICIICSIWLTVALVIAAKQDWDERKRRQVESTIDPSTYFSKYSLPEGYVVKGCCKAAEESNGSLHSYKCKHS